MGPKSTIAEISDETMTQVQYFLSKVDYFSYFITVTEN